MTHSIYLYSYAFEIKLFVLHYHRPLNHNFFDGVLCGLRKISSTKELNDAEKLYENLPKLLENILESKQQQVYSKLTSFNKLALIIESPPEKIISSFTFPSKE